MTREALRALGYTDEQVEQIMRLHGQGVQALQATAAQNAAEITRLRAIETEYNQFRNQPPANPAPPEPQNPELAQALQQIADLQKEMNRKDIAVYAGGKGLSGEQVENVLKAFADDVELAKAAIDSISQIISDTDKAARDAEKKALLANTPNPGGGAGGNPADNKTEDVKNAESITFGSAAAEKSAQDFYVLK